MSTHTDLIAAIGREQLAAAIAERRGLDWEVPAERKRCTDMVYQWEGRGIASPWRPFVDRLARKLRLSSAIPDGFLDPVGEDEQQSGPKARSAA